MNENAVYRERKQDLHRDELGIRVLENARTELYLNMRFLDGALASLRPVPDASVHPAGTDGLCFFFSAEEVMNGFLLDRRLVNRLYMHVLTHCLFGHLFARPEKADSGQEEQALWNLSCDIAAEYLLDELTLPCFHQKKTALRQTFFAELDRTIPVVTAQLVFRFLTEKDLSGQEVSALREEFCRDDHSRWHSLSGKKRQEQQKHWEDLRGRMQTEMETFSKEAAAGSKALHDRLAIENRKRYDYREFLRKFSVLREEMQVDPDSFDQIFYHYGMELYGNMPLIEPLETKEIYQIEDFVIVLDTSMSCRQELIRRFLEETFTILSSRASFSRKVRIRLIQCDDKVQQDTRITSLQDVKSYMEDFKIVGLGGTDFRPAFSYVNALRAKGEFRHLKGLLYFTDGYGVFPVKKPLYDTAFIFVKGDYSDVDVPPWAMKVILDDGQLMRGHDIFDA